MKLIIKEGESVDNALKYLQDFLGQFRDEYPILKGNMNIYVTLEGFGHRVCPENERELVLNGEEPFDLLQNKKDKALSEVMSRWKVILTRNEREIRNTHNDLRLDKEYLATAAEKGRRPDLIEKREKMQAKHEEELKELLRQYHILSQFNKALEEGRATAYYTKIQRGKSAYKYELDCKLVFDNIDGMSGYCDRYGFHEGLPCSYK